MSEDTWEPTDDVESIEDPTERRLRWILRAPDGSVSFHYSGFHTRTDGVLGAAMAKVPAPTLERLNRMNHEVAGWDAIAADGWRIEPWTGRSIPLLFKRPMVRALIDRRKVKSRRLVVIRPEHSGGKKRQQPDPVFNRVSVGHYSPAPEENAPRVFGAYFTAPNGADLLVKSPYGQPGDELWVRESFSFREYDREIIDDLDPMFWYWADGNQPDDARRFYNFGKPKPSIHMPRVACRIRLFLESLTVERLLSIPPGDVREEGIPENWGESDPVFFREKGIDKIQPHEWDNMKATEQWSALWDAINGAGSAARNPWVWVLGFHVIEAPPKVLRLK